MSPDILQMLLSGLWVTIQLSVLSILFSLVVGVAVAMLRASPLGPVSAFAQGYVEFFRNIPLLIILFFVLNGLPQAGITLSYFWTAVAGLSVYTAAYVAEVVRAGLESLAKGQTEAARSLGLSWLQMMRLVLLPQALRLTIPPLGNLFVALIKNTALASAVAVPELLHQAEVIEGRTFNPQIFLIAGLMYLLLTVPLSGLVNLVEERLSLARITR